MRVLGIESSCDETAAAVIERHRDGSGRILSNIVRSQIDELVRDYARAVADKEWPEQQVGAHPSAAKERFAALDKNGDGLHCYNVVRNDKGNYHFTTSRDGKTWTTGKPLPH